MASRKIIIPENQEELLTAYEVEQQKRLQDSRKKYRKIVQAGIAKWIGDFQQGKIIINSISDLHQLIEMDLELQIKDDR